MKRWHAIAILTVAVAAFAGAFQVRTTDEGVSLLYRWGDQAKECDEGGGCVVLSGRQVEAVSMLILQELAARRQRQPQQQRWDKTS